MEINNNVKRIPIKEFREKGFLFEANRKFFHPLGLALEVIIDEETGEEKLGGIWDYRADPEGMFFHRCIMEDEERKKLTDEIEKFKKEKVNYRKKAFSEECDENGIQIFRE